MLLNVSDMAAKSKTVIDHDAQTSDGMSDFEYGLTFCAAFVDRHHIAFGKRNRQLPISFADAASTSVRRHAVPV
jgi:hypothetical protein